MDWTFEQMEQTNRRIELLEKGLQDARLERYFKACEGKGANRSNATRAVRRRSKPVQKDCPQSEEEQMSQRAQAARKGLSM